MHFAHLIDSDCIRPWRMREPLPLPSCATGCGRKADCWVNKSQKPQRGKGHHNYARRRRLAHLPTFPRSAFPPTVPIVTCRPQMVAHLVAVTLLQLGNRSKVGTGQSVLSRCFSGADSIERKAEWSPGKRSQCRGREFDPPPLHQSVSAPSVLVKSRVKSKRLNLFFVQPTGSTAKVQIKSSRQQASESSLLRAGKAGRAILAGNSLQALRCSHRSDLPTVGAPRGQNEVRHHDFERALVLRDADDIDTSIQGAGKAQLPTLAAPLTTDSAGCRR